MTVTRLDCDLVIGGGGSLLPALLGATYEVARRRTIARAAGTSAGSIAAAAVAFRVPPLEAIRFCREHLRDNRMLDLSWNPFDRYGMHKGEALHKALQRVFPGSMRDSPIPLNVVVCDLYTRRPMVISSKDGLDIPVADALLASCSIPLVFKAVRLKPWGSRLFVDGGVVMNFAMDLLDDSDRPTIGIRLRRDGDSAPKPVRSMVDYAKAMGELLLWSSDNAHISSKNMSRTIDIATGFDSLDFDCADQIDARWRSGAIPAARAITTM